MTKQDAESELFGVKPTLQPQVVSTTMTSPAFVMESIGKQEAPHDDDIEFLEDDEIMSKNELFSFD